MCEKRRFFRPFLPPHVADLLLQIQWIPRSPVMTHFKFLIPAIALVALMAAAPANAPGRGRVVGHAAPRVVASRVVGPRVVPIRPYIYRPGVSLGFYSGYPYYYGLYGYPVYGYPYGYPVYGYAPYGARAYGGV